MIVEMGCLILGVPVGFLLRRKPLVIKITDQVLTWSVRILLLLLGLALGADDRLKARLERIVYEFIEEIDLARTLFQHVADDVFRQVLGKLHIVL